MNLLGLYQNRYLKVSKLFVARVFHFITYYLYLCINFYLVRKYCRKFIVLAENWIRYFYYITSLKIPFWLPNLYNYTIVSYCILIKIKLPIRPIYFPKSVLKFWRLNWRAVLSKCVFLLFKNVQLPFHPLMWTDGLRTDK